MKNPRFIEIDSRLNSGIQFYDKVLDMVVVEINTNNKAVNRIIANAVSEILDGKM